nr:MAG TPA: ParB protein [Caudoviricetes sp.]
MEIKGIRVVETDCMLTVDEITPYANNAKQHPKIQIDEIKESIRQFGMDDPIGVWGEKNIIVEGHGRFEACKQLGITTIPCIRLDHLTDEQRRAYGLAHNQLTLDSGWEETLLASELAGITDIDMSAFGFDVSENETEEPYTMKTNIPQYEITGAKPTFADMLDTTKTDMLIAEIENADITEEEREFLVHAAGRHSVFNYRNIAEYYAHATPEMQRLMERSALVIIDVDNAIANGYAKLSAKIADMVGDISEVEDDP